MGAEGGKLLEGEAPVSASEAEVVGLLDAVAQVRGRAGGAEGAEGDTGPLLTEGPLLSRARRLSLQPEQEGM